MRKRNYLFSLSSVFSSQEMELLAFPSLWKNGMSGNTWAECHCQEDVSFLLLEGQHLKLFWFYFVCTGIHKPKSAPDVWVGEGVERCWPLPSRTKILWMLAGAVASAAVGDRPSSPLGFLNIDSFPTSVPFCLLMQWGKNIQTSGRIPGHTSYCSLPVLSNSCLLSLYGRDDPF